LLCGAACFQCRARTPRKPDPVESSSSNSIAFEVGRSLHSPYHDDVLLLPETSEGTMSAEHFLGSSFTPIVVEQTSTAINSSPGESNLVP
jgi:hypothetical protein